MKQYGRKSSLDVKLMSTAFTFWMLPNFILSFFISGLGEDSVYVAQVGIELLGSSDPLVSVSRIAGVQACANILDIQILKLAFGNRAVSKQGFTFIELCSSMCFREKAIACIDTDV